MLTRSVIVGFLAIASANPLFPRDSTGGAALPPQLDIAAVAEAGPPPQPHIAIDAASQTVAYHPSALASQAAAEQSAQASSPDKRSTNDIAKRNACDPQIAGAGPNPTPDTDSAFLSMTDFAAAATNAPTPAGYENTFTNLQAMNNAMGYMGYTLMNSYDVPGCSAQCDQIYGCAAFNVAFERAPSVDPGDGCDNPPSTTLIKCVFWGGPVTSSNAVNRGEWRDNFHVVIAGSNGYVNQTVDDCPGYTGPNYIGGQAINAPADCNGQSTLVGYQYWNDGRPYDTGRCAAACTAQTQANPSSPCTFFNTYVLSKNNQPQGQYCAMYKQNYDNYYATLSQVTYNGATYSVSYSYSFYNTANPTTSCVQNPITSCSSPGQCGTYRQCNPNEDCYCGSDVSGNSLCFQDVSCSTTRCSTNASCGSGYACLNANSCCGYSVCVNTNICANGSSPSRLFRKRLAQYGGQMGSAVYPPSN